VSGGGIVCVTGLPASGKSTLAARLQRRLREDGVEAVVLDGDAVREALVPAPGYDREGREAFYASLANLAGLLARQGLWVIASATHPLRRHREQLRRCAGTFLEVYVDVPLEECRARDPKGLYAQHRAGLAPDLPGPGAPFERPLWPDVTAAGGFDTAAVARVAALVRGREHAGAVHASGG